MAFEIARQKGCVVKGISLSKNQINYCKKAKELNLDNKFLELADYRSKGKFEEYIRLVCLNMLEKNFTTYFLNQSINF